MIHKIEMTNFRGFRNKIIDFDDKAVVLFSAANGIGKTTTIDAIEWCLTGDIGRLKAAYDSRSTNYGDRKRNTDGILKNRDAGVKELVRVVLWLFDGEKETILCRSQIKDELNPELSKVTLDESEDRAKVFIKQYVGESFYNLHFCDVQKSFNIQNKKRKDLKDFFNEFITNYDEKKQVADNLDIFAEDVDRYIEDKEKQKIRPEVMEIREKQLEKVSEEAKQIPYPKLLFYTNEKTEIVSLNKEELIAQKENIKNCGYQRVKEELSILVENEILKNQRTMLKKLDFYWKTKGAIIQQAVKVGISKNLDAITTLEMKYKKLMELSLSKEKIFQEGEVVIALKSNDFTRSEFEKVKKVVEEKEKKIKNLSKEIDLLSKNNEILKVLAFLSVNKKTVIKYREEVLGEKGEVQCPVCGSKSFATIEKNSILKEADEYIKQNGEVVKIKEDKVFALQAEITNLYHKIINCAKIVVDKEKKTLENEINNLKMLKDETQPYFDIVRKLQEIRKTINVEELNAEKVRELLISIESEILEETREEKVRKNYYQILDVLGYEYENETVQQTYAKMKNLLTDSYEISEFSYDVFVSKINAIDSILANQTLFDLKREIEANKKKNQNLNIEIEKLRKLKEIASQRAENIRYIVEKLSKDEYEKVGPTLSKFYNKLARFNSNNGINIVQENDGISLVDNKGKNIVNVLSNGQISVFMLAYFFAGINVRNNSEKMKIYFIDDLTACMDDVNMLAFMDLLKYQVSSKATMDQLFFITCDDRISNLLKYKLNGRGIKFCEILEKDLA